jgi:hypothetical protein
VQPKRLVILLPVLALPSTGWLPFANDATLWFGIPSIVVWVGVWCDRRPETYGDITVL